eukprot:4272552-Pleurochrysis_carterae.AAC.1
MATLAIHSAYLSFMTAVGLCSPVVISSGRTSSSVSRFLSSALPCTISASIELAISALRSKLQHSASEAEKDNVNIYQEQACGPSRLLPSPRLPARRPPQVPSSTALPKIELKLLVKPTPPEDDTQGQARAQAHTLLRARGAHALARAGAHALAWTRRHARAHAQTHARTHAHRTPHTATRAQAHAHASARKRTRTHARTCTHARRRERAQRFGTRPLSDVWHRRLDGARAWTHACQVTHVQIACKQKGTRVGACVWKSRPESACAIALFDRLVTSDGDSAV